MLILFLLFLILAGIGIIEVSFRKKLKNDEIIIDKLDQLLHEIKAMNKDNSS
ncbi:MAG: hypothetical protein ACQEXQ_13020 [Bacillota bacterium]